MSKKTFLKFDGNLIFKNIKYYYILLLFWLMHMQTSSSYYILIKTKANLKADYLFSV